jgi:hypothetical protein
MIFNPPFIPYVSSKGKNPHFALKSTPKTSTPTGQRTPLGCVEKANRGEGANASENGEKQPLLPFSSR